MALERRFCGDYKIGLINRIRYPLFAIYVLETNGITDEEKEKFVNGFLKKYMSCKEYRNSVKGKLLHLKQNSIGDIYDNRSVFGKHIQETGENSHYVLIKDSSICGSSVLSSQDIYHNKIR